MKGQKVLMATDKWLLSWDREKYISPFQKVEMLKELLSVGPPFDS